MNLGPNPDENEEPGARLGRITPSGWKKRSPGACSGGRVEMLLLFFCLLRSDCFPIPQCQDIVKMCAYTWKMQMLFQGMVSLVSADGLHQLHIFVFFLAVFHVTFSAITMSLGRAKVKANSSGFIQVPLLNIQK
jgi:hypothetical protein